MTTRDTAFPWPTLISIAVAVSATGIMMFSIGGYVQSRLHIPIDAAAKAIEMPWLTSAGSILLFALSYPLYRARAWARTTLFILSALACVAIAIHGVSSVLLASSVSINGSWSAEEIAGFRRSGYISGVIQSGIVVYILAAQAFITAVLQHPDVVRSFRGTAAVDSVQNI